MTATISTDPWLNNVLALIRAAGAMHARQGLHRTLHCRRATLTFTPPLLLPQATVTCCGRAKSPDGNLDSRDCLGKGIRWESDGQRRAGELSQRNGRLSSR